MNIASRSDFRSRRETQMRTRLQRQQEAERALLRQLQTPGLDRIELSELVKSVLSTAAYVATAPGAGNHQSFSEKNPLFFRELTMNVVDRSRNSMDPLVNYQMFRAEAMVRGLQLSENPLELAAA